MITENSSVEVLGGFLGYFKTQNALIKENQTLKQDVAYLKVLETERDFYKLEKEKLEELLGRIPEPKEFILARIISKPGFSPYDTIIIDAGAKDAVKDGALVYADGSIVLGHIAGVNDRTSVIKLFSSPEERINVFVGSNGIEAVAIGKGGGTFELKLPRNTDIKEGDLVTMASTTGKIFGTIRYISNSAADAYEKALFKSPIDASDITWVLVEKNKK